MPDPGTVAWRPPYVYVYIAGGVLVMPEQQYHAAIKRGKAHKRRAALAKRADGHQAHEEAPEATNGG